MTKYASAELIKKFSDTHRYPIKTEVFKAMQPYLDEPVYKVVARVKPIIRNLYPLWGRKVPKDLRCLVEYKRHLLHRE